MSTSVDTLGAFEISGSASVEMFELCSRATPAAPPAGRVPPVLVPRTWCAHARCAAFTTAIESPQDLDEDHGRYLAATSSPVDLSSHAHWLISSLVLLAYFARYHAW